MKSDIYFSFPHFSFHFFSLTGRFVRGSDWHWIFS